MAGRRREAARCTKSAISSDLCFGAAAMHEFSIVQGSKKGEACLFEVDIARVGLQRCMSWLVPSAAADMIF